MPYHNAITLNEMSLMTLVVGVSLMHIVHIVMYIQTSDCMSDCTVVCVLVLNLGDS